MIHHVTNGEISSNHPPKALMEKIAVRLPWSLTGLPACAAYDADITGQWQAGF
jgi:hypothetical protein